MAHLVVEEIWNRGDLEMADRLFTLDYVNHGGLIPDLLRGPEAVKLSVAIYRSAFPTFELSIDDVTPDNGAIVLRWVAHSGPALADDRHPRSRGLRGITRFRLRGYKIAESWTVWDSRAAVVQLSAGAPRLTRDCADEGLEPEHGRYRQSGRPSSTGHGGHQATGL